MNDNDQRLVYAAGQGDLNSVIDALIPADIHTQNDMPLAISAANGHVEVVKFLLDVAKPNADIHANNDLALRNAIENNHVDVASFLLDHGADRSMINNTMIKKVEQYGFDDMVRLLSEYGGGNVGAAETSDEGACVAKAIETQESIEMLLFERQQARERSFYELINPHLFIPPTPHTDPDQWPLFTVFAVGSKTGCFTSSCFERMFEVVAAPIWEWAILFAVASHFDRYSPSRNDNAWSGGVPIISDLLVRVTDLKTGFLISAYCTGRCLNPRDSSDEANCSLREILLPLYILDDEHPPASLSSTIVSFFYSGLAELFEAGLESGSDKLECICSFPLQASKFVLDRRLRQYNSVRPLLLFLNNDIRYVIPGSDKTIPEILEDVEQDGGVESKNMPMRLFTCPHSFHLGCISEWYCHVLDSSTNTNNLACPICNAPMASVDDENNNNNSPPHIPETTVYYPTSIPF